VRRSLRGIAAGLLLIALAATVSAPLCAAERYPARTIKLIVAFAPGGVADIMGRLIAQLLQHKLGGTVIIENKPGGAGVVAGETIAKGASDGYTLAVATSAVLAIRPTLFKVRPFEPLVDFVPISHYVKSPFVLIVAPSLPVSTVPEFIKYAKERPGQLSYGSSGIGGAPHLTGEWLKQKFGFDIAHVPYRNSPQLVTDVAAGHVAASISEAGASLPLIKDGKLKALAVTSGTRFPTLPDVPTLAEALASPDLEAVSWHVIFARHDTPRPIIDRLHSEIVRYIASPEGQEKLAKEMGLIPGAPTSPDELAKFVAKEVEDWGKLVRLAGAAGIE
jgi:tripartite-type tricarboxylate transporter receptor subunit TctC